MDSTVETPSASPTLGATLAAAHKAFASGDHPEASRLFGEAIAIAPENAEAHFNLGTVLLETGQLADGVRPLQVAIDCQPDHVEAFCNLGCVRFEQGFHALAALHFWVATLIDGTYGPARENLDEALEKVSAGGGTLAISERQLACDKAFSRVPEEASGLAFLATQLLIHDQPDLAKSLADIALTIAPGLPVAIEARDRILGVMKRDWDRRARENSRYYIHSSKEDQTEEEFHHSGGGSVLNTIESHLGLLTRGKDPKALCLLEIGCGTGRMTRHIAEIFGEVHGVDVSSEMIAQGRKRLVATQNAWIHVNNGRDLSMFEAGKFDIVFSFIVLQHIPFKDVVLGYIREAHRVLKAGGMFKFQVHGDTDRHYVATRHDTWYGAPIHDHEVLALCAELGFEVLWKDGQGSQYSWYLCQKR